MSPGWAFAGGVLVGALGGVVGIACVLQATNPFRRL